MIDIKRRRFVDSVAQQWKEWLREYFLTVYTGKERPWAIVAGRRRYFDSYADKLYFQLERKIKEYARGRQALERWCLVLLRWFWIHFDDVIQAKPDQLEIWVTAIKQRRKPAKHLMNALKDVLLPYYEILSAEYGHNLVKALGIKTCPYCNRQFIHSFEAL